MALEQKLSLKLSQKLVMTPSLQQAIKLLQMTRMELDTLVSQELVENPVLEEATDPANEEAPAVEPITGEPVLEEMQASPTVGVDRESMEAMVQGNRDDGNQAGKV